MHDQCTEKCLVQAGQKKEIILLSRDIPIWDTSYIIMSLLHKRTCKLRPRSPITCCRFQMVKNQLDFSEVFTVKRGTYNNLTVCYSAEWTKVEEDYMTVFPHSQPTFLYIILAINCVYVSNWFTHLQQHHKLMVKMIILFVLCNGITFYIVK